MSNEKEVVVNLATYMERLDAYIESQTTLNATLSGRVEKIQDNVNEMQIWRSRVLGAKTGLIAVGLLILHTSAVMISFIGIAHFGFGD